MEISAIRNDKKMRIVNMTRNRGKEDVEFLMNQTFCFLLCLIVLLLLLLVHGPWLVQPAHNGVGKQLSVEGFGYKKGCVHPIFVG